MLLLSATNTTAQTVDLSTLEQCAGLETEELKLACFEAIIDGSKTPDTPELEAAAVPVSEPPVAEVEAVPEAEPPAQVTRKEAPAVDAAADSAPTAEATSTAAMAVKSESSAAPVATAPNPMAESRLGEEHLDRPETENKAKEDEVYYATVTEVSEGRNEVLYFHFDNGQVWRQIEGRHFQYPRSGEFDVRITRGMMGEYRMRIGEKGRMVRIRRVQ